MAYGLRYFGEFEDISGRSYRVEILQKDYSGVFTSIKLGATPAVHSYQTDDIRATVRGASATINIINSGSIPITTFYSVNDDEYQVKILQGSAVLFIGFLVQDDTTEIMVDYAHDITIQCNDNLGLLKDVTFNKNASVITDFYAKDTLARCVHQCLVNTSLELDTYVYANLWEDRMAETDSFLPQTYIDLQTFISGDKFMSCYQVLDYILDRFNLSLFQAQGRWNIVRWDELYRLTTVNGFKYSSAWVLTGTTLLDTPYLAAPVIAGTTVPDTYPEYGLRRQIVRPFQFDQETFNYGQIKYLLRNYDLMTLGTLLRSYNSAGNLIKEYEATNWTGGWTTNTATRFIRVVYDSIGNEIERYLTITGATTDSARSVASDAIEVSQGDKLKFSFSFKTNIAQAGPLTIIFAVRLYDGVTTRYIGEVPVGNGNWIPGIGFNYSIASGDNSNTWHSVSIESSQIPYDGLLYCYLATATQNPQNAGKETLYKDIRLEYTPFINDSIKIIGHIHKDIQTDAAAADTKNNEDITINIDDSPKNPIQGTLFMSTYSHLVRDRTSRWHRAGHTESKRIGEITTKEVLQWRSISRAKLEGSFRGLWQSAIPLTPLSIFKYQTLNPARFILGQSEFDYKNNKFRGTLWQLDEPAIDEPAVNDLYTFTYIYEKA